MSRQLEENTSREKGSAQKKRESNLDLLRGICAIFVVFEHFCEKSMHNAFGFSYDSSMAGHILLRLTYGIARTAVPVFFLISGYLSIRSQKQRFGKVVNLFFMTAMYSLLPYMASCAYNGIKGEFTFSIKEMIIQFVPKNYYLYLFCALYIFSPFLNKGLLQLDRKNYLRLCIILFSLFSVWSTITNTVCSVLDNKDIVGWYFTSRTGSSMGFNIANFTMMYIIGGYLRLYYQHDHKRDCIAASVVILCSTVVTSIGKICFPKISGAFWYYDSVFIILSAIALFILFLNITVKPNKIITFMGVHTFGTFLIHGLVTGCIKKIVSIKDVVSKGFGGTLLGILIFVIGVYILALLMTSVLELIISPVNKKWCKTKLYNWHFWEQESVKAQ